MNKTAKKKYRLMTASFVKKFTSKLGVVLILSIFFNGGCTNSNEKFPMTPQEKVGLEKFFRLLLFYVPGIYTLLGSKPITTVCIEYPKKKLSELSDEELEAFTYFDLNRDDEEDMRFYKRLSTSQKEKAYLIPGKNFIYHMDQLWDQWERMQHRFPLSKRFLLVKRERPLEKVKQLDPNLEKIIDVMFVNVFQAALLLEKHYDLFRRAVGFDFDPLETVFALEDPDSRFWNSIRGSKHSYLWGLLYGFGEKNTWGYFWKGRHMIGADAHEKEVDFAHALKKWSSYKTFPSGEEKNAFSISNFSVPAFASFSKSDPVVMQYEEERKRIQKMYRGKDFVQFTLQLLSE